MPHRARRRAMKRTRFTSATADVPSSSDSDFVPGPEEPDLEDGGQGAEAAASEEEPARRKRKASKKLKGTDGPPLVWESWEEENEKWLDDHELASADAAEAPLAEVVDPSPDVLLPLLRYQKEWLAWALKQEDSDRRGGILADEMGMGKTIQAISLVLTARHLRSSSENPSSSSSPVPTTKCTLVICPVVAVIQWAGEIEQYTEKGSARVLVYHGAKRLSANYNMADYDFVLTTYSTIESEYRKYIMPPKERCQFCGKLFYPNQIKVHLRYYCGPWAQKTEKQAKQVSKKKRSFKKQKESTLSGEGQQGRKRMKGTGRAEEYLPSDDDRVQKYKGKGKKSELASNVTDSLCGKSPLHSVRWERIILDEAHFIKDRRCNTAKAVFALQSQYKWALSGTPLQNRVGELYSLVRFLQIFPYSYYFCKDCDCKVLERSSSKQCTDCPHSSVRHFCWWNRNISKPIQDASVDGRGQRAMVLLKDRLLESIILRRTKKGRAADIALPPKIVTLRRDTLDRNEQEFYEALYTQSRTQFDSYVAAGTLMNNYAHIFDLLTRLRQAVDHPYLVVYSKTADHPDSCIDAAAKTSCAICHHPAEDMVVTSCEHVFCKACLIDYSASSGHALCPSCSKPLTVDLTTKNSGQLLCGAAVKGIKLSGILGRLKNIADFKTSTKIDALREEIRNMVEGDGSAKGIVFSQFTSFLDLINFSLQMSGIKCVQLVGSMSLAEREKVITAFKRDPDCKVFLMSLKAGGVALNLTVASHVFLMDPWWNPAVEKQAQDRIHRIGQYKPIRSTRFVIENTVEERILKLQEKKELVFEGTIGNSSEAMAKLTEADLRFLFHT